MYQELCVTLCVSFLDQPGQDLALWGGRLVPVALSASGRVRIMLPELGWLAPRSVALQTACALEEWLCSEIDVWTLSSATHSSMVSHFSVSCDRCI